MFDQKRDKEQIEEAFRNFLNDKFNEMRDAKLKRYYNLLVIAKISAMYTFAFVGFAVLFYHFILGQPYVCSIYKDKVIVTSENDVAVNQSEAECASSLLSCESDLKTCQDNFSNLDAQKREEYLKDIFEPICQELGGGN